MVVYGGARKHSLAAASTLRCPQGAGAPAGQAPVLLSLTECCAARVQNGIKKLKRLLEEEDEQQFSAEQYMQMYTCAPRPLHTRLTLQCVLVL